MKCRYCEQQLTHVFVDLGEMPPSNAYISPENSDALEAKYPLKVFVCNNCWLVQTQDFIDADKLFSADYAYFSSVSTGWLKHAKDYVMMITQRLSLTTNSFVLEIASNDGYLLKNFVDTGIPCLGIEPTIATSEAARALNIPVINDFFSVVSAKLLTKEYPKADLIIANNVLAHVPDIKDFIKALVLSLSRQGTITLEFPHLLQLIENNQFDTIYHEHFSYLSLSTVHHICAALGLAVYDVEPLETHGGSLRLYLSHQQADFKVTDAVLNMMNDEKEKGLQCLHYYLAFQPRIEKIKQDVIAFLTEQKKRGKSVMGYGAAAKGNTLLNYAGITTDLLPVICDAAPSKQNRLMPGSHIPIKSPKYLEHRQPDYIFILPWNIKEEVTRQLSYLNNVKFLTVIPELNVL